MSKITQCEPLHEHNFIDVVAAIFVLFLEEIGEKNSFCQFINTKCIKFQFLLLFTSFLKKSKNLFIVQKNAILVVELCRILFFCI